MKKGIFVCLFLLLFLVGNVSAATYFVKTSGSNALAGNNWNNAWSSIQWASVGPGDTICYAGSTTSYGSLSLTEGGSIASPMTIKRATTGDPTCGSSVAGWSSSFDSVVNFGSAKLISNFIIDGMVPNGIKFKFNGGSGVYFDPSFNQNIVLKNLEIEGPGTSYTTTNGENCPRALSNEYQQTYGGNNINISRVSIHDSAELIQLDQMDNVIVEYSTLYNSKSGNDALCHGNVFFVGSGSDYGTFRYNNVYMMSAEGLYFAYSGNTGWKIYGNVFHDYWPSSTGRGIEWNQGGSFGTFQVHNNVFYNLYNGLNARGPTSGEGYNNIFSGASGSWSNIVTGDNINGNVFKDAANGDFTLAANAVSAINQGTPLAAEYSKDANGNTRGADGSWDIGAFELSTCTNCRYIRQGATGSNNGSDWTNAYTSIPATLTRGYTYFIADGSYGSYTFDDATSGAQYITLKKATTGDHGTDTGWSSTYADAQTTFSGLQFAAASYYILDGQIDKGMYTSFTGCNAGITLSGNSQYIEIRNFEIEGPGVGYSYTCGGEAPGIYIPAVSQPSTNKASHILIHNVDIHDMNAGLWIFDSNNMTVQYSEIYDIGSGNEDPGNGVGTHSNLMYVDKSSNFTVRYNNIHDYISTGIYCAYDGNIYRGFKIYGNVFHDTVAPLIGRQVQAEIYNNAFYNAGAPDGNFINLNSALAGSVVYNNIFWNGGSVSYNSNVTRSNNLYTSGYWGHPTGETGSILATSNPFVNAAGGDFNIVSTVATLAPRNKGLTLSSQYNNVDANGVTRGADGLWDIGAFEVSGSAINGVCSSTLNSCTGGTFSELTDNSTHYLWQCTGSGGGSTASCSILITPQNGVCGAAARTYVSGETFPTGNLCQVGNSNPTSPTLGTGNGASTSWTCSGLAGGSTSPTCTAVRDATCQSTTTAWQNIQFGSSLTGYFTATFNVTPTVLGDAVYGLAPASATDYTSLATLVRFNDSNAIDVRNGATYSSTNTVSYNVGTTYQIRIVANVTSKTYSVYVKAGSNAEVLIANNFAFRSDQSTASSLSYFSFIGSTGDANVCAFSTSIPTVPNTVYHPADTNNNLALTPSETTAYINSYFSGSNSITESLYALTLLQSGGSYSNIGNTNCASTPWNCWVPSGVSAPVDTTPPSVTASPLNGATVTSSSATLSVTTNEAATCRYSTISGSAFSSMTNFASTGSTSHSQSLTGLTNGVKNYYVKCQDSSSNTMTLDHTITFTVSIAVGGTTCEAVAGDNCFYVDSSASAGGNGQSWSSAWNTFSAITWASVGDGDYIYISGGSTNKTYSSALTVGASGSASKPLTIKVGQDTNHNGNAIIDINGGQNSIVLSGRSYVTIDGEYNGANKITLTDAFTGLFASSSTGVKVKNMNLVYLNRPIDFASSTGLVIDGNNLTQVRGQSGQDGTAIDVAQSCASGVYNNVIVTNNYVEISSDGFGPDGVKPCSGQTYSNNTFRSMSAQSFVVSTTEHSDIFQGNGGSYIKIFNNEFINVPETVVNFGSWTSNAVSNIYLFNNIFRIDTELDQLPEYFRVYANPGTIPSITNVKFINNIFVDNNPTGWAYTGCDYSGGGQFCPIRFDSFNTNPTMSGNEFKNNIFYNMGSATDPKGVFISIDASTNYNAASWIFGNNVYYHPQNNFYIKRNGVTYNKTQWASQEPSASMAQPQFLSYTNLGTNNNFRLAAGDTAARDNGENLNSYCSQAAMTELCFDKDGIARPASGNWNAGPFEN